MDRIRIVGGRPLHGIIPVSGAKNAALPLMAACLLSEAPLILRNLPHLADITTMSMLLAQHGVAFEMQGDHRVGGHEGHVMSLNGAGVDNLEAPYDIVRKMRASVLVLGPLLARFGQARVSLPGGCAIGTRPVDLHIRAMEALGAEIEIKDGYIEARAPGGLKGAEIFFPKVSVGATENALMAAVLAKGRTIIENAAREPEVSDLANCLNAMGAGVSGIGSDRLVIEGAETLHGATYSVLPDRIEAGTYAMAAAITGGDIMLAGASMESMEAAMMTLRQAGARVEAADGGIRVSCTEGKLRGIDVETEPYPGFPTDLQAQLMALLTVADGASLISETIFENRFMHAPELARMGADIHVRGSTALVRGVGKLRGAPVMATDLRASVSLVLAGLAAEGETIVNRVYHLDRGYERLEEKLAACGAVIERLKN